MPSGLRLAYNTPRGIIHPSQVDFSVPFDYRSELFEETFNDDDMGSAGYILPGPRGIDFWPAGNPDDNVVSQQLLGHGDFFCPPNDGHFSFLDRPSPRRRSRCLVFSKATAIRFQTRRKKGLTSVTRLI